MGGTTIACQCHLAPSPCPHGNSVPPPPYYGSTWDHAPSGHTCSNALYNVQCCPVCQGRGNVPAGFYSRAESLSGTAPEVCQTCDGRGILKVSTMSGSVEKLP